MSSERTSRSVLDPFTGIITSHTGEAIDYAENLSYIGVVNLPEGTQENVLLGRPFAHAWRMPLKVHAFAEGTPIVGVRQGEALIWGALAAEIPDVGECQGGGGDPLALRVAMLESMLTTLQARLT